MWIMVNKALKIPLIRPRKSIYTAIVYNDLCINMDLKQYDISLLHTQPVSAYGQLMADHVAVGPG